jgi:hypothetical protein
LLGLMSHNSAPWLCFGITRRERRSSARDCNSERNGGKPHCGRGGVDAGGGTVGGEDSKGDSSSWKKRVGREMPPARLKVAEPYQWERLGWRLDGSHGGTYLIDQNAVDTGHGNGEGVFLSSGRRQRDEDETCALSAMGDMEAAKCLAVLTHHPPRSPLASAPRQTSHRPS